MQIGRVVGQATSTVKHPTLNGWRLLLVQLLTRDGKADGEPLLAIDTPGRPESGSTSDPDERRVLAPARLVGAKNSPIAGWSWDLDDEARHAMSCDGQVLRWPTARMTATCAAPQRPSRLS